MELYIFDLDDTLFKTTAKVIVRKKNNIIRKLSNAEYSTYQLQDHEYYDFSEFKDANLFNETATPIHETHKILKAQLIKESDVAQYILFNYKGDLTNNFFSDKEWPRPLKSWLNKQNSTTLVPCHEDLDIITKFFEVFAPKFEKVLRKHLLEIIKNYYLSLS